jgi:hypothetical protein
MASFPNSGSLSSRHEQPQQQALCKEMAEIDFYSSIENHMEGC